MILNLFLGLTAVGFAAWILGLVFGHREAAVIGGVIVVGAGVAVIGTGLEYRSGQVRNSTYTEVNNSTVVDSVEVEQQWRRASLPQQYSLGFLVTLLGASGMFRALDET